VKIDSVEITAPNAITLTSDATAVDCNGNSTGTTSVTAMNGAGNFNYLWSDPNGQTTATAIDLPLGTYTVTVTDANLCTATIEAIVTEPDVLTTMIGGNDVSCFDDANGEATITPSGGTPGYTYLWSNGATTPTASNLIAGTITCTVTDANGCTSINTITLNSPPEITLTLDGTDVICFGGNSGAAIANASGGAGGFTYLWSNNQTSTNVSNLTAGITTVTATDINGCAIEQSITINEPSQLTIINDSISALDCNGSNTGAIGFDVIGGTGSYDYNWSTGSNTQSINSLGEGTYTVTVSDDNGCFITETFILEEPSPLDLSYLTNDNDCFGFSEGTIDLSVTGSIGGGYSVAWTGPNGFTSTDEDLTDLAASDYNIIITNSSNCTIEETVTINQPAEPLSGTVDVVDVTCFGGFDGQIIIFAEGGTFPYRFSVDGVNFNGSSVQVGIYAGTYNNITIQDANGCQIQLPSVTVNELPEVEVDLGPDTTIVFGQQVFLNPTILNATGGVTYEWLPRDDEHLVCNDCAPPVLVDSLDNQTSYSVVVTDENGCKATDIITIFVLKFREVLVATGFSPNGDTNNDLLIVHGRPNSTVKLFRVYDRWGELIYENGDFPINDPTVGWDGTHRGKPMNPGVYVWYAEVEFEDGETKLFKGQTTLLR